MAEKTVTVACKLPNGIIIEHPADSSKTVKLNGINKEMIIGSGYGLTEVDGLFMAQWVAANKEFKPLKSGAIFIAKNSADAAAIAEERKEQKTGLEPMRQDGTDSRAQGVIAEKA